VTAIEQELASAGSGRLAGITLEGEPGIGKTRLLLATGEMATARGFTTIAVTGDEELRGPFLVARSIVGSTEATEAARGTPAEEALSRCMDAMSGQDDPSLASLSPDRKLLRTLDLGAVAIRDLAVLRPVALLIDDLQWADDDSLRLLRYIVRADATSPIFVLIAIRPEELAFVTEAVNLVADMDRAGLVRRLRLDRFSQLETRALLQQVLGGTVDAASAALLAEGWVPRPDAAKALGRDPRDEPRRGIGHVREHDVWPEVGVRETLEDLGTAALGYPRRPVHDEVLEQTPFVRLGRRDREGDARVAAEVPQLPLIR
jgi:hypothetical protein